MNPRNTKTVFNLKSDFTVHILHSTRLSGRILILATYVSASLVELLMWKFQFNTIYVRLPVLALILPVAFYEYWPSKFQHYVSIYWKVAIGLALPFSFTTIAIFEVGLTPEDSHWNHHALTEYVLAMFIFIQLFDSTREALLTWVSASCLSLVPLAIQTELDFASLLDALLTGLPFLLTIFVVGSVLRNINKHVYQRREMGAWNAANSIAHQLRTPLLTIANHASAFKTRDDAEKSSNAILTEVQYSNQIIDHLVTNSHGISSIENTKERFSIEEVIHSIIGTYPFNNPRERDLVHVEIVDFTVYGSRHLVTHIFYNLLSNALEFAQKKPNGRIKITSIKGRRTNQISVYDTGIGIQKKHIPLIFEPFFTTNPDTGTGIGLSFCRTAMREIRGSISVNSSWGHYTEFILEFPINQTTS